LLIKISGKVPGRGLEPLRIAPPDPKSGASANFATPAFILANALILHRIRLQQERFAIRFQNAGQKRGRNLSTTPSQWQHDISGEHVRLRERINSGLAEARRKGVKLGRPERATLDRETLLQKHREIVRLLKDGQSVRSAAKISDKGISTVQRMAAQINPAARACRFAVALLDYRDAVLRPMTQISLFIRKSAVSFSETASTASC
jgi:hypothetical protein